MTWVWLEFKSCELDFFLNTQVSQRPIKVSALRGQAEGTHVNRCVSRSVNVSQPFIHTDVNGYSGRGEVQAGRTYDEGGTDDSEGGGLEGSAQSRHSVSFNCPCRMWAGDLIGPTGSPGIWEPSRERGHVTSTHHQLSQILLAQLAGSGVISQFPKAPREISSPVGPSSKRTGDRFTGWSGLLGSDKEPKLRPPSTPTHITSDEINLHHWIQTIANAKTTSEVALVL